MNGKSCINFTDAINVEKLRKNLVVSDAASTKYEYILSFWMPYGALGDSVMIECFQTLDKVQAREKVVKSQGYNTRILSDKDLLEMMGG